MDGAVTAYARLAQTSDAASGRGAGAAALTGAAQNAAVPILLEGYRATRAPELAAILVLRTLGTRQKSGVLEEILTDFGSLEWLPGFFKMSIEDIPQVDVSPENAAHADLPTDVGHDRPALRLPPRVGDLLLAEPRRFRDPLLGGWRTRKLPALYF